MTDVQSSTERARRLRRNAPLSEKKLWYRLNNRQLGGFKFVRQHPIGPYFADFCCRELKLVVEIDGWTHSTEEELASDKRRSAHLRRLGFHVVRFTSQEVLNNLDGVLETILISLDPSKSDLS